MLGGGPAARGRGPPPAVPPSLVPGHVTGAGVSSRPAGPSAEAPALGVVVSVILLRSPGACETPPPVPLQLRLPPSMSSSFPIQDRALISQTNCVANLILLGPDFDGGISCQSPHLRHTGGWEKQLIKLSIIFQRCSMARGRRAGGGRCPPPSCVPWPLPRSERL